MSANTERSGDAGAPAAGWAEGWRPWAAFLLGCLFFCYGFFQRVSPSVMVEDLMRDFAVGAAILGNLSAFYFYAYAPIQIPVGLVLDRYGPRRLLAGAAALCGLGSLVFALAHDVNLAYLGRFLVGAGAAFTWVGAVTLVTLYFPHNRFALLIGVTQFFGMAGGVFGQAPLAAAVARFGWRPTLAAAAAIGVALGALIYLVVRDRGRPAQAGAAPAVSMAGSLRHVASKGQTWIAACLGGALVGPVLALGGLWGVPYLMQVHGIERTAAAGIVSLSFIGFGLGAPVLGWLSDHIRRRRAILIAAAGASVATLSILLVPGLPLSAVSALLVVHGAGAGAMVLSLATAREHNRPDTTGAVYGLVNTAVVGGGALLQPAIGYLLDLQWDGTMAAGARVYAADAYRWALATLPLVSLIGLGAALMTRETYCRQVG
jgi:MFS family permease